MKKIILFFPILFLSSVLLGQTYSFEVEMKNFKQLDETKFEWEIYLRKGSSSNDFALYSMQTRLEFNTSLLNGGNFLNEFLTIDASGSELFQEPAWFNSAHVSVVEEGTEINWATIQAPAPGEKVTIIDGTWRKVATFRAQLRKDGNPHNFANVNPEFAFELSGLNLLVRRCDTYSGTNPSATMIGGDNTEVPRVQSYPALGVPVNTRQLAGYWFSGDGDWTNTARWNNVTTENKNQLPTANANANAIINGNCTIPPGSNISMIPFDGNGGELTVLTGEEPLYTLTITSTSGLFNVGIRENHGGGADPGDWLLTNGSSGRSITVPAGQEMRLYTNDPEGWRTFIRWEDNDATIGTQQNFMDYTMPSKNITVTAVWNTAGKSSSDEDFDEDFTNLVIVEEDILSSKSFTKNSLFASLTISPGASLTVDKLFNDNENGAAAIQLLSNSSANASLIHNNTGVSATVKRTFSLQSKFHFISSPVTETVSLNDVFPADQNKIWVRVWDEAGGIWVNQLAASNFMYSGIGYVFNMDLASTTAIFEGTLNTTGVAANLSNSGISDPPDLNKDGWNLIGNPFSSSINLASVTLSNTTGQVAVWSGANGNYLYKQDETNILPGGIIPPNQAMFVKATAAGTTTIPASARTHSSQALHKNEGSSPAETLRLDITNEENPYRDAAFIRFHPDATQGFDNYLDAHKLFGETTAPQLFFTADNLNLSINALPAIEEKMEIPLSVRTGVNTTYTISASGIESFDPAQAIFLKDMLTGAHIDLRLDKEYAFQTIPDPEVPQVRFVVQFFDATVDAPDIENELIRLFSFDKTVCAYTPDVSGATLALTNMLGQRVFQTAVNGAGLHSFETGLSPGLYILSLQTEKILQSRQIIIK